MQRLIIEIYSQDGTSSYPVVYDSKEALIEFLKPKKEEYKRICEDRIKIRDDWWGSKSRSGQCPALPIATDSVFINGEFFYLSDMADDFSNILTVDEFFAEAEQSVESSIT